MSSHQEFRPKLTKIKEFKSLRESWSAEQGALLTKLVTEDTEEWQRKKYCFGWFVYVYH